MTWGQVIFLTIYWTVFLIAFGYALVQYIAKELEEITITVKF